MRLKLFCAVATASIVLSVHAQDYSDVIIDDNNKDSSSFVVDPDPLDPLPVNRENIKDGDEIILDDIRGVLDSQLPAVQSSDMEVQTEVEKQVSSKTKTTTNKSRNAITKKRQSQVNRRTRFSDEPDYQTENKLYQQYLRYDQTPTSAEQWGKATAGQRENIYVVQKMDNLYTISRTLFGDSKFWPKIWALNRDSIFNPHQIYPGMKIYFYSGDGQNAPTLSLSSQQSAGADAGPQEPSQNTEFGNRSLIASPQKNRSYPVPIPESLPETYSSKYFSEEKNTTQIDIRDLQYNEPENFTNPYTLSSTELQSDFVVPADQVQNLLCKDNQFVPIVVKKNINVGVGRFLIVEKLVDDRNRLKNTHKYKKIGSVIIDEKNQMRVSNCNQLMDTKTLIISEDKLASASVPTETFKTGARIVDGFEFLSQEVFSGNQYLIVNVDGVNAEVGGRLNIYSDAQGKVVGQLKIIQRTGTMAIAVVTQVKDQINHGDRLVE